MKNRVTSINSGDRKEFDWGSITWLHNGAFSGAEELTVGEVIIKSGKSNPMHTHSNCEEVLYLLEGNLEHSCGDEGTYELVPGDSICIGRDIPHNAVCTSDVDARMVVTYSSPDREMKGE